MNRYRQNHVVLRRVLCRQAESQTSFPASTSTVFNQFYVARDPSRPHLSSPLTLLTATSPPGSLRALDDNADQNADDKPNATGIYSGTLSHAHDELAGPLVADDVPRDLLGPYTFFLACVLVLITTALLFSSQRTTQVIARCCSSRS